MLRIALVMDITLQAKLAFYAKALTSQVVRRVMHISFAAKCRVSPSAPAKEDKMCIPSI
jgi:hypothetical protein